MATSSGSPIQPTPYLLYDGQAPVDRQTSETCLINNVSENGDAAGYSPDGEALTRPRGLRASFLQKTNQWQAMYQEAAVYLLEGLNNDKLHSHPSEPDELRAYHFAHSTLFHLLDLFAGILIMLLALVEPPTVFDYELPSRAFGSVEVVLLGILAFNIYLRVRWLKWQNLPKHRRILAKLVIIVVMVCDVLVVIITNHVHFRIVRALRPFFVLDSHYFKGVRRAARQIIQAIPVVLDMVVLLLFVMVMFAAFASFVISGGQDDPYFATFADCFYNLFILMTTANFPDVMMPSYYRNRASALFFIVYVCVMVFILLNLLLAVVVSSFQKLEKEKFRKLLVHKRKVVILMYELVTYTTQEEGISFEHFAGIMKYFKPRMSRIDKQCAFLHLSGGLMSMLTRDQFHGVYEATSLKWSQLDGSLKEVTWYANFPGSFFRFFRVLDIFVQSKVFEATSYLILFANFAIMLYVAVKADFHKQAYNIFVLVLLGLTVWEIALKVLALGPRKYARNGWNLWDTLLLLLVVIGIAIGLKELGLVIFMRSFRLLRLFQLRQRYQDVMATVISLVPQMASVVLVIVLLYYLFSVIGMEVFSGKVPPGCCGSPRLMVGFYYANSTVSNETGFYYLNNFNDLAASYVTLFELMVINNWWITMNGFVSATNEWARIFFILYYFLSLMVLNILVAFVLDAFVFHLSLSPGNTTRTDIRTSSRGSKYYQVVKVKIEYDQLMQDLSQSDIYACPADGFLLYEGRRRLSRQDFSSQMHNQEVQQWLDELESEFREAESHVKADFFTSSSNPHSLTQDIRRNALRVQHYVKDMMRVSPTSRQTSNSTPYVINLSEDTGQPDQSNA